MAARATLSELSVGLLALQRSYHSPRMCFGSCLDQARQHLYDGQDLLWNDWYTHMVQCLDFAWRVVFAD